MAKGVQGLIAPVSLWRKGSEEYYRNLLKGEILSDRCWGHRMVTI
ncbi:hypothetical protein CyaNS01_02870 [Cyanobium sp. NS01]|nr:hypothetical protein CyaNS01_02870 [Cyanobium sp. NS01]